MKSFSELQDINRTLPVRIRLDAYYQVQAPQIELTINKHTWDVKVDTIITREIEVDLLDPILIQVKLKDKDYTKDSTTAIIVRQLSIDKQELLPNYVHLTKYSNDHNMQITTEYLGYNGTWTFDIKEPFYRWLHEVTGQGWLLYP